MTAARAIEQAEAMRPGSIDGNTLEWLYSLEARIFTEVVGMDPPERLEMTDDLIATGTYERIYPLWIVAQYDLNNAEIERYHNDVTAFNEIYEAFCAWWTRTHTPPRTNYIKGVKK
jgi:hypothetical protein